MQSKIAAFGPEHVAILAAVPLTAWGLATAHKRWPEYGRIVRFTLVGILLAAEGAYYWDVFANGKALFPDHLPFHLCDIALWLMILTLLTRSRAIFDVAYYWAIAGTTMALLTPNITEPGWLVSVQFYAEHGGIVASTLYLLWSRQARPRPGSLMRAFLWTNVVAAVVGLFDFASGANYMFIREKPPTVSLLDAFGPWPWYIAACEFVGTGLFALLYLPFWNREEQVGDDAVAEDARTDG